MNTPSPDLAISEVGKRLGEYAPSSTDFVAHFWERVASTAGDDACWPWAAARSDNGYGVVWADGRPQKAHRIAWQILHGPLEADQRVLHHCDNPPCCNPAHLFAGSSRDNTADMLAKGRGGSDGRRHLTREQVVQIRELYAAGGATLKSLGQEFGVLVGGDPLRRHTQAMGGRGMNSPVTLDALRRLIDTRRRIDRLMWKARSECIARQLREMRARA